MRMDGLLRDNSTIRPGATGGTVLRGLIARQKESPVSQRVPALMPGGIAPERAAATALGRAAERTYALPILAGDIRFSAMSVPEIPELLPERPLLAIVEDCRGRVGFVALCPGLLASMIEMQALGRITSRPVQPRRPTRTDAAIATDFVNALLDELGRELAGTDDAPPFGDFRYVAYMDDSRPLALMLEDAGMHRLSLAFRIGSNAQRNGAILIGIPGPQQATTRPVPALSLPAVTGAPPYSLPPPKAGQPWLKPCSTPRSRSAASCAVGR